MPFENLKRQLDLQKQAQDAVRKHQQWLAEQPIRLATSQRMEQDRQEKEKMNQIRECFSSSHIDEIANELMKVIPDMQKTFYETKTYYKDLSKARKIGHAFVDVLFGPQKHVLQESKRYFTIQLTWNKKHDENSWSYNNSWNYIDIGFLEDKTLFVDGDRVKGGLTRIPEHQWRGNPIVIENAIENAILHPQNGFRSESRTQDGPFVA